MARRLQTKPERNARSGALLRLHAMLLTLSVLALAGCWSDAGPTVVVYTALDSEFSEPIFDDFTAATGVRVLGKFDTESTKTVGLAQAIMAESERPRCDVFWNNEILNTLRLEDRDLLARYDSPAAEAFPPQFRSTRGTWHGFAARARVLIVNTDLVGAEARPTSIHDLVDPKWKDKVGVAKPLFGTTASHAAVLFAHWGDERAKEYFTQLHNNAQVLSGNKQVALAVARGQLAFGLTDTDDAHIERVAGHPVAIVYPDQGDDALGTLFIPNTLAIIKGGKNADAARKLVDYLLSPQVEAQLAQGRSAQIPLNPQVDAATQVETPKTIKPMPVDFAAAAAKWDTAATFLADLFAQ